MGWCLMEVMPTAKLKPSAAPPNWQRMSLTVKKWLLRRFIEPNR
jgi:hypothetical protein